MRYVYFLILLILFACKPKEEKPEIDYVNIDIFGHPPSSLRIDLLNNTVTFSKVQYFRTYSSNCKFEYEPVIVPIEFIYIQLNDQEAKKIHSILNNEFLDMVKRADNINKAGVYEGSIFDGIMFKLDILKSGKTFSTEDFIIFEEDEEIKLAEIIKILYPRVDNKMNKEYLKRLLVFIDKTPSNNYIHGLH